jgi:hypothetical protein
MVLLREQSGELAIANCEVQRRFVYIDNSDRDSSSSPEVQKDHYKRDSSNNQKGICVIITSGPERQGDKEKNTDEKQTTDNRQDSKVHRVSVGQECNQPRKL